MISLILLGSVGLLRSKDQKLEKTSAKAPEKTVAIDNNRLPKTFLGTEFGVVFPCVVLMMMYFGYSAIVSFVALYATKQDIDGIGLFFSISAISLFIARYIFAKLVKKCGYHKFVMASLLLFSIVLLLIPHLKSILTLYIMAVFYGAALGVVPMAVNAQVLERCSVQRRGTAMAAYTASMDIGIGLGSLVVGFILDHSGYILAFSFAGAVCFVSVVIYALTVARDHDGYIEKMNRINRINH